MRITFAIGAMAASLLLSTSAQAAVSYGSGGVLTIRPCPDATSFCVTGPAVDPVYFGGAQQGGSATKSNSLGSVSNGQIGFTGDYLPQIRIDTTASATDRVGANAYAFQTFTYTGSTALDLGLLLKFHYVTTGSLLDPTDPNNERPGDASGSAFVQVMTLDSLAGLSQSSTGRNIFDHRFGDSSFCLGSGFTNSSGTTGENTLNVLVTGGCGDGVSRLTINPNQTFVVGAFMQTVSNRSGAFDASHTLSVLFDADHTYLAGTDTLAGQALLNAVQPTPVPEPASWALAITGFGVAGTLLRDRRRRGALTAA